MQCPALSVLSIYQRCCESDSGLVTQYFAQGFQILFQLFLRLGEQTKTFHIQRAFQAGGIGAAQQDGGKSAADLAAGKSAADTAGLIQLVKVDIRGSAVLVFSTMCMPSRSTSAEATVGFQLFRVGLVMYSHTLLGAQP